MGFLQIVCIFSWICKNNDLLYIPMVSQVKIENILFLDIETVPAYPAYDQVPERFRLLWDKKATYLTRETGDPASLYQRAGIYAEFGRIICISTGMIVLQEGKRDMRMKSFFHPIERDLLGAFADLLTRLLQKKDYVLCAHNGKEFDFPYIARRMLINGIPVPEVLDIAGKRPWEVKHLDTLELWKFGDYKHYTSLELLASVLGLESPKSDIDGSQVAQVYWYDQDIGRIVEYCRRDVITIAQIMLRYKGEAQLRQEEITVLD